MQEITEAEVMIHVGDHPMTNEYTMASQMDLFLAGDVLEQVVQNLRLTEKWHLSEDKAKKRIRKGLTVKKGSLPGRLVLEGVTLNPALMNDIVDGVCKEYASRKQQISLSPRSPEDYKIPSGSQAKNWRLSPDYKSEVISISIIRLSR